MRKSSVMGRAIAPAAQDTPVPQRPLVPSPWTHISGTIGTATMRGTGRPLKRPATGGPGLPRGATVARGQGSNISQTAPWSRGVPLVRNMVRDRGTAVKQTAAVHPQMKMKPKAA